MKILIIGSGAREHALAWKIAQSPLVDEVLCAPGNPGIDRVGVCFDVAADDIDGLEKLALQVEPDLIVVGPEIPLALGLSDLLRARGFDVFGPSQRAAQLESSKIFSKQKMVDYGVPTARYGEFTADQADLAKGFLDTLEPPYVLKADGLAGGKGVIISEDVTTAKSAIDEMLSGQFGEASSSIIIEEFMHGEEASIFVMTDGKEAVYLPACQDHKRVGEGDTGPNTGGMGSYGPAPVVTDAVWADVKSQIAEPMLKGMAKDGMPYAGVLYIGIMVTQDGPKVVEFNVRFGDPECQVLMAGIPGDIVPLLLVCATGGLVPSDYETMLDLANFKPTANIVMAAKGYPGSYEKGSVIKGAGAVDATEDIEIFHAGTDVSDQGDLLATGGRVLSIVSSGETLEAAFKRAYEGVDMIDWPGGFFRRDIGWRVRG